MREKVMRIGKYATYALLTNVIYGFIVYNVFTWLAGYSMLYAYLGNLALIIIGMALDESALKMYQSKQFVMQMKKEKGVEKYYRLIQWQMDSFISFKTVLYLFYIVILIVSRIIDFNPTLVGKDLGNFIHTTDYSILILVAFDALSGQFSKDRKRIKETSAKFMAYWNENQD